MICKELCFEIIISGLIIEINLSMSWLATTSYKTWTIKYGNMETPFEAHLTSIPPQPNTSPLLTLILCTRGAKRNTKSSTVAMEFWKIFLLLFSSSSLELLWQGCPGEPWFSTWWMNALLLPPQLEPRSVPPNRSLLQSWGASRSIQWRVWRSFVSATPSLSWWPAWGQSHSQVTRTMDINFRYGKNILALLCSLISWETLAFLYTSYIHGWNGSFFSFS